MYATYFGLREYPFGLISDPRFFYPAPLYQGAYISIRSAIRERQGLILLTGEPGTGKSTLLRRLSQDLQETVHITILPSAVPTFDDILSYLCAQLSLPIDGKDLFAKLTGLSEYLHARAQQNGIEALFIDEAQSLAKETLDRLRLLSSLEGPSGKLLQIVLAGQTELESKLTQPDLRHIYQRITVQCRLPSLPWEEVEPFIQHRLHVAGCERQDLFTPEAIQSIASHSQAIPRLINVLCDNALLKAYTANCQTVSASLLEEVADNLQLRNPPEENEQEEQNYLVVLPEQTAQRVSFGQQPWTRRLLWTGICLLFVRLSLSTQDADFPLVRVLPGEKEEALVELYQSETLAAPDLVSFPLTLSDQRFAQQLQQSRGIARAPSAATPQPPPPATPEWSPQVNTESLETQPVLPLLQPSPLAAKSQPVIAQASSELVRPQLQEKKPEPRLTSALAVSTIKSVANSQPKRRAEPTPTDMAATMQPSWSWPQGTLPPAVRATLRQIARRSDRELHVSAARELSPQQLQQQAARLQLAQQGIPLSTAALLKAAAEGNAPVVTSLVTAGVSPNGKNEQHWTALMFAARDNNLRLVQTLLAHGADVNAQNETGETALMLAAINNYPAMVQALLNGRAAMNTADNQGLTALMHAAWRGYRPVVEILLNRGANPDLKDKEGRTAIGYAAWQGGALRQQSPSASRGVPPAELTRFGRLNTERMQLMKRQDYNQIAALLQKAERKK